MTTAALGRPQPLVLADLLPRTLARDIALVVSAALFTAALAQVAIPVPGSPVPITGQTLAVVLTAAALGPLRGLAAQATYLLLGLGLPFYAGGDMGWQQFTGATGGYLVGFLPAAYLVGLAARYSYDRQFWKALPLFAAGQLVIFAVGVPWLAVVAGFDLATAIEKGFTPFVIGGVIKAILAAGLLPAAWRLARWSDRA